MCGILLFGQFASVAEADLDGDTIEISVDGIDDFWFVPSETQSVSVNIGQGLEAAIAHITDFPPPATWYVDVDGVGANAGQVTFTNDLNGAGFEPVVTLNDLDWTEPNRVISDVQQVAGVPTAGVIDFGDDFTVIDLDGGYEPGDYATFMFFTTLLGDVNEDDSVNLLDVDVFVELVTSGAYQLEADVNRDGFVDLLDVPEFIAIVSGG